MPLAACTCANGGRAKLRCNDIKAARPFTGRAAFDVSESGGGGGAESDKLAGAERPGSFARVRRSWVLNA